MRPFSLAAAFLLLLAACTASTEDVLPIPTSIRGASFVRETDVIVRRAAIAKVATDDEKLKARKGVTTDPASMPFAEMLSRTIAEVTRASGLSSGRPLKLIIEVDNLKAPRAGAAFFGADDELAGSVYVRDAGSGEELGQLYVKVGRVNGGLASVLVRGGGVREQLAQAFAQRVAKALGGR